MESSDRGDGLVVGQDSRSGGDPAVPDGIRLARSMSRRDLGLDVPAGRGTTTGSGTRVVVVAGLVLLLFLPIRARDQAPRDDLAIDGRVVPAVEQGVQGDTRHRDAGTDGDHEVDRVLTQCLVRHEPDVNERIQDVQRHPTHGEGDGDGEQSPRHGLIPLHVPLVTVSRHGTQDRGPTGGRAVVVVVVSPTDGLQVRCHTRTRGHSHVLPAICLVGGVRSWWSSRRRDHDLRRGCSHGWGHWS